MTPLATLPEVDETESVRANVPWRHLSWAALPLLLAPLLVIPGCLLANVPRFSAAVIARLPAPIANWWGSWLGIVWVPLAVSTSVWVAVRYLRTNRPGNLDRWVAAFWMTIFLLGVQGAVGLFFTMVTVTSVNLLQWLGVLKWLELWRW